MLLKLIFHLECGYYLEKHGTGYLCSCFDSSKIFDMVVMSTN